MRERASARKRRRASALRSVPRALPRRVDATYARAVKLTARDLLSCLDGGEGTRIEFKRRLPRDDRAARTLCAFANTRGGLLIVGVTDLGRVHGVHRPDEVTGRLVRLAGEMLAPAVRVEVQTIDVEGPRVVACSVPFSKQRPHAVLTSEGAREYVVRVGASNRVADGPTLAALRLARRPGRGLSPLELEILAWVEAHVRGSTHPGGTATVARFAKLHNVGEIRARRAFVRLEGLGLLLGHGAGRARIFTRP